MFVESQQTHRVIVAEDEPASLKLLTRQLERAGFDVTACTDGRAALNAIQSCGSALVIADWMMPEMDGVQLCRAVRELSELGALGYVYFILLTAHSDKEQVVAGLEAGADDYLTKPYHIKELLARLGAGQRIFDLQLQLMRRQVELHKVNAEMASLNQKLHELAHTDALTRLPNRRALFTRFGELWNENVSAKSSLSVAMLDIDRFKRINDTHSHAGGDAVLREVADEIRAQLRGGELAGRFGGEEFCILLPGCTLAQSARRIERLRAGVAARVIRYNEQAIPVTISAGVAVRGDRHAGPDDLIGDADAMLYRAKESGRNQVWTTDGPGCESCVTPAAAERDRSDAGAAATPADEATSRRAQGRGASQTSSRLK